ncbi:hypothetical protein A9G29_01800 [Gilliamella sp. Fer2-1]|uniref:hypothetical protein n=1 Tax=Gilliamella sp. Nev6-6 TaxID=3120252 RepID=UPI00080F4F4F|nr:hypothetical protein [Gilliamella apicola]OCG35792.1 hypothetical protein A9G29_01800 [Gilliamella apicola]OCG74891.1 hypothetical protein A9G42_09465 [Gilliamella apicola]
MSKITLNLFIAISLLFSQISFANNNPYQDSEIDINDYQLSQMKPMARYDYVPVYPERLKSFNELLKKEIQHKKITLDQIQCIDVDEGKLCNHPKVVARLEFDLSYILLDGKTEKDVRLWDMDNTDYKNAFIDMIQDKLDSWLNTHGLPIRSSRDHVFALTLEARKWYKDAPFYVIGLQPTKVEYITYKYTEPGLSRVDDENQYEKSPF